MKKIKTVKAALVCVAVLFLSTHTLESKESSIENFFSSKVEAKTLDNGITVIMVNRGFTPTLALEIAYRVGSSDESYKTTGIAHFLEHMLFKGTSTIGTKDYKKEKKILDEIAAVGNTIDTLNLTNPGSPKIPQLQKKLKDLQKEHSTLVVSSPYSLLYSERGGIGLNASTSRDRTGYYLELPSKELEFWAKIESERIKDPVFREFFRERNNVIEERRMRYESDGSGSFFERFMALAFESHPYRHPIIGWKSNIPHLSLKDMDDFYRKYYIPSRMTITIVGSQDTAETFRLINQYFGDIPPKPDPLDTAIRESQASGEIRFTHYYETKPTLAIAWHKPTYPHRDDFVMDVLSEIVSGGAASPLREELVIKGRLALSVGAWNGMPGSRYDNLFMVYADPRDGVSHKTVEDRIYQEISRIVDNVSQEDIERVIRRVKASLIFRLDSNKGISRSLSYFQTVYGDWQYPARYLKEVSRVTPEDIKNAYKKYMVPENRIVGYLFDSRNKKK